MTIPDDTRRAAIEQAMSCLAAGDSDGAHAIYHELTVRYDRGSPMLGIAVLEFRGEQVALERIYVADTWDAPDGRAPWRSKTAAV